MYRPGVAIIWNKKHSNDLLPSSKGSSPNTQQPSAAPKKKLLPWLDLSHHPTLPQVIALKRYLVQSLPIELVNIILSFAEYWPHASSTSCGPRTIEGKAPGMLPYPASAELWKGRSGTTLEPALVDIHNKDNLLVQSAPLGLSRGIIQPWASSTTQHPARMLIVEVTARQIILAQQSSRRPNFLGVCQTWLDIGVVDSTGYLSRPLALSTSDAQREARHAQLDPSLLEGIEVGVLRKCHAAYHAWLERRSSRAAVCLRVNLPVNEYLESVSRTIKAVYRFDDDEANRSNTLNPDRHRVVQNVVTTRRREFLEYVKRLAEEDRRDEVAFVRALRAGDEIGVWARVNETGYMAMIEGVRMTVFWEV